MRRPRPVLTLLLLATLVAAAVVIRLAVGRGTAENPGLTWGFEHLDLRTVRVLSGAIVGVCLAVAGVFLQSLLRNPLASPDIVGLASGSGFGVMVAAFIGYKMGLGLAATEAVGLGTSGAALAGSFAALVCVWVLSRRKGLLDPIALVLVGVAVSIVASAGTKLVQGLLPDQGASVGRKLLGAIREETPERELWWTGAVALVGVAVGVACGRAMDAAALGDDEARSVGVPVRALRIVLFLGSGVLTAASVVLAGPVGFVGLVCPHVVRMLAGPGHRVLVVGGALAGVVLVIGCDVLVRMIDVGTGQLPIGVLTSLVGGPVLIGLLRRERRGLG
ncbi:Hemin transport system permease protein HmuU [Phycisphaerales bacterium]|nr:Hemin transport system permease protein HmuU [Phycisphaerales bacterium]